MSTPDHSDLPEVDLNAPQESAVSTATKDEDVWEAMKDVVDPELGINVVDLGLVYGVDVDDHSNTVLSMTLTSAACPLTDVDPDSRASRGSGSAASEGRGPEVHGMTHVSRSRCGGAGLGPVDCSGELLPAGVTTGPRPAFSHTP